MALAMAGNVKAQHMTLSKEDFRARQKEYFMEQVQLNESEANQYFHLYYELQDKKSELNRSIWQKLKRAKDTELSDEEYNMLSEDIIRTRIQSGELDMAYFKKYKKFLSARKIYLLQKAEMSFHREMLKRHRRNCQTKKQADSEQR